MIPFGSLVFAVSALFFALQRALWEAFVAAGIAGIGIGFTFAAMPGIAAGGKRRSAGSGRLGRSRPGRRRGRRWPGPRHRLILDDQRRVAGSGETHPVRDRFPYPGMQSGGHSLKSSPGNQQAIPFVWCA
jgi:hypothetical protein